MTAVAGYCPTKEKITMSIQITSNAFSEGELIPDKYSCDGQNISPPLRWTPPPQGARSLVLICEDPDAPSGNFVHWVLYDLPPTVIELPEATPIAEVLANKGKQGRNDFDRIGYGGPCPPRDGPHRYFFRLYGLDAELRVRTGASKDEVTGAMDGHILDSGELMGFYKRK
jgi:Raf kinase inhibitor-like YbhB/YbcL family protein